jgi:4-hydroxythreonine-4-phosphate dehydrogenase
MSREGTSSIGIAALSPHAGESGMFGQREIDEIVPSVGAARAAGVDARGSFPADTIFMTGRDGHFDGIVTMSR